jgi:hypothetical protein
MHDRSGRSYLLGVEGLLTALVVVLVLFLVVGLVLFLVALALAGAVVVLADVPAGDAALGAWAAKVKGMVATARAIAAKNVVFIFFSPCGPIARLQSNLAPDSLLNR